MRNDSLTRRIDPIPALKRQLGQALAQLLKGGNADDVAASIGTDRPRVSELRRGKLTRFSLETLIRYLDRLDHRIDINVTHVRPNHRRQLASVPSQKASALSAEMRQSTETLTDAARTGSGDICNM